jgi:hypothetical protein
VRPNKSGHWWYERKDREEPDIWSVLREKPEDVAWKAFDFENHPNFKRWIGPAHPPKKVKQYAMDTTRKEMFEIANGAYVEFDDVKEYLLGYEDEKESED